jgi:hypothetical protein
VPDAYRQRLTDWVIRGNALFIIYGSGTTGDRFNSSLGELAGVTIEGDLPKSVSRAGYYSLNAVDDSHPIFSVFDHEAGQLPQIRFYALPQVRLEQHQRILMRLSGDHPGLVESSVGKGTVLTLLAPISPEYSDIVGHAFFVPFMSRTVEYLTRRLSSYEVNLEVGQSLQRGVVIKGAVSMPLIMQSPDSTETTIPPTESTGGLVYRPAPLTLPGVYRTSYLGSEVDRFALNVPAEEGDLGAVEPDQLATALNLPNWQTLDYEADPAKALAEIRHGRELWKYFLWLALILVAIEMLLARSQPEPEES